MDEYQDTNEVQNCIFRAVSRQGENIFAVGDVKQSIYRFRLAEPGIFLEKIQDLCRCGYAAPGAPRRRSTEPELPVTLGGCWRLRTLCSRR